MVQWSLRKTPRKLSKAAKVKAAQVIMERLAKIAPDPRCELYYETPYQLLVSVVLSAQTTDKMVNRCMEPLYRQGFGPQDVIRLGAARLLPHIRSIGFAPTKAKNIFRLTEILINSHQGAVPGERAALEALPGVGRKTANVVLAEIFGEPTLAVDTHVFRVGYRLGLHTAATPEKAELELLATIPLRFLPKAHHWLILHGRYTCKALRPLCAQCPLVDVCAVVEQHLVDETPALRVRVAKQKAMNLPPRKSPSSKRPSKHDL